MTVGDLMAALRMAGCSQTDIDKALRDANDLYSQAFRDAEAEEEYGPALKAAFAGDYEPFGKSLIMEPLIAYALFMDGKPESLAEVLDTADFIIRGLPPVEDVVWAFLQLRKREWLMVQGKLYGLTAKGRDAIGAIVGRGGTWDCVKQLEKWVAFNPA